MQFKTMFALQDPSTSSARHARLQICTSFIRIAKAAGKSILPHEGDFFCPLVKLQANSKGFKLKHGT